MSRLRPLLLIGTRPEAIKLAPVIQQCSQRKEQIEPMVCLTGQHSELVKPIVSYFGITPHHNLELMRPDQDLSDLTGRGLQGLAPLLHELSPDCVVAQGDTTTVLVGSMAAFFHRVPFVHVEAGLRTYNLDHPWPEEFNRRVVSIAAAVHCAPTRRAAENLLAERVRPETVHVTGNTVVDALLWTNQRERANDRHWQNKYTAIGSRRMVLITGHRRENFGPRLNDICLAINALSKRFPDVEFVYPVHLNPNVERPVRRNLSDRPNIHLLPPVPYPECVWLMDRCTLILTDSGGIQEEAPSLKKPVLVLRNVTERPEAVEAGAAEVVGTDKDHIVERAALLLTDSQEYARRQIDRNPYGDGHAGARIVDLLESRPW